MEDFKAYIVKAIEQECGVEFFKVCVSADEPVSVTRENFIMASRYADPCFDGEDFEKVAEGIEAYDEHFSEMAKYHEENNGQDTFNYYLEKICGYKVTPITYDFEYE